MVNILLHLFGRQLYASVCNSPATFLVSDEMPCPMEKVTFTCTAPGDLLRWSPSDDASFINVNSENTPLNMPEMPRSGYTVTLTAFNNTSLTSTLSRIAENGIIVICLDPPNDMIGSATIQLAGEVFYHSLRNSCIYTLPTQFPLPPLKELVTLDLLKSVQ